MAKRAKAAAAPAGPAPSQELKQRLLFVLGALVVFRVGSFIPVPGIDPYRSCSNCSTSSKEPSWTCSTCSRVGRSGDSPSSRSVMMPYISASIIMQLLSHVEPKLKELRKEGESGRRVITRWTRYATVVLATFQAFGVAVALEGQAGGVVLEPGWGFRITTVATLVTGTVFLMWLGEQISERGIGNGISILIYAGIVAGLPSAIGWNPGTVPYGRNPRSGGLPADCAGAGRDRLRRVRGTRSAANHRELREAPGWQEDVRRADVPSCRSS